NDEDCLAYSYENTTQKGVIDKRKLEEFEENFKGLEPSCARVIPFDYNIKVKTLPINFSTHQAEGRYGGIFGSIKSQIDGKKIIFVIDGSGSMDSPIYSRIRGVNRKIDCVREPFLKGFVDKLSDDSEIAIIRYSGREGCNPPIRVPGSGGGFVRIGGNRGHLKAKINSLFSTGSGGTPMCVGLEKAFKHSRGFDDVVVVLLTDGVENTCCQSKTTPKVARNYRNLDIEVYSVGFGTGAAMSPLEEASGTTGGQSYAARTCEELMEKIPEKKVQLEEEEWNFGVGESESIGVSQFSTDDAKENSLTIVLPVSVRYGPSDYKRAVIHLKAVKGKLERLSGYINRVCKVGSEKNEDFKLSLRLNLENPIEFEDNKESKICMLGTEKTCKILDCDSKIDFENIKQGGDYLIRIQYDKENNEVEVRT
ncbi:MAG: VWA domain-containing protein, partial [Candidatus Aenigmatarchaeota archaeon]